MLKYHCFRTADKNLVFLPDAMEILEVPSSVASVLELLESGLSAGEAARQLGIKEEVVIEMVNKIESVNGTMQAASSARKEAAACRKTPGKKISTTPKLTLCVAQECNLNCKYCYAKGGTYGSSGLMDKKTAIQAVDYFKRELGRIEYIMFFGGEPFLNPDVIAETCKYAAGSVPILHAITNGTVVSDKILNIIKTYDMKITVSLDGEKRIHDRLRPFKTGSKSSFDVISGNLALLKAAAKKLEFEATYTRKHADMGFTPAEVKKYLSGFGFDGGTLTEVGTSDPELKVDSMSDSPGTVKLLENNGTLNPNVERVLLPLLLKQPSRCLCPIGSDIFAVDVRGDIYPCHMFIGQGQFKLGNVKNDCTLKASRKYLETMAKMSGLISKQNNARCRDCWASPLCKGCPGSIYLSSGKIEIPDSFCCGNKRGIEQVMAEVYAYRQNPQKWQTLAGAVISYEN